MNGYQLSPAAQRAESNRQVWRGPVVETKDILPWRGGAASTENGDNFVTNQVTVAQINDWRGATGKNALGLSATWACINLLAGTIASLPLVVYRTDGAGVRRVARDHGLYWILHDSPNYDQTSSDFWEIMAAAIELNGNAYAIIERRAGGEVSSLKPLVSDAVTVRRNAVGLIEYRVGDQAYQSNDVLHIRGPLGDALSGMSTLSACRGAFDSAMAANSAAQTIFGNGIMPSGILSTDPSISLTPEQRVEFGQHLDRNFRGAMNAGRPMLLDRGMKWTQLNLSPEDAQMLESRGFGIEEICRVFGVPPHMVGHSEKSTSWGSGIEQQTLGFVKFSLRRRLKRIEQALAKQLLTSVDRANGVSIEFNLEGLLRGDSAGRAGFYQTMTQIGAMTINEVRALENQPPVEGGDVPRMQSQNQPITQAGKPDGGSDNAA